MSNQYRKLFRFGSLNIVIARAEFSSIDDFYSRPPTHPDNYPEDPESQLPPTIARRKALLPREGLTFDTLLTLFQKTLLNPALTIPFLLFLQGTAKGKAFITRRGKWLKTLKFFVCWSVLYRINNFLNWGAANNWKRNRFKPNEEIVLVTGGSGGVGGAIVRDFAAKGVKVVVLDVQPITYETSPNVYFYQADLRSLADIAKTAASIRTDIGPPTVLINNAGVCRGRSILDSTEADVRLTFDVNVFSHFWLLKEFLPSMVRRNHGHVVTVASVAGYLEAPQMVDYSASKAAAVNLHEGLRLELKFRYNAPRVRTTLVTPSFVKKPLFKGFKSNGKFFMPLLEPETLAEAIVDQVCSGDGGHIILPKVAGFLPGVKGWSRWLQSGLQNATRDLMSNWHGKQVLNPDKENAEKRL